MAQTKLTKSELAIREIAKMEEANVIINYAIAEIEKDLEKILESQNQAILNLQKSISEYLKNEFEIEKQISFEHGYLYIYWSSNDFRSISLRLEDEKLLIRWFASCCRTGDNEMINYLSMLGIIAGNMDKIETQFKIWMAEYHNIMSFSKEKNKLLWNARNQISINEKEILRLKKKIK